MAVNDINARGLIPGAYITLIERDSFPQDSLEQTAVTDAVYASVTLLQQGVIGVIGDISSSWTSLSAIMTSTLEIPQCSFTASAISFSDKTQYKYFFRTIPTQVIIADVMLSFAANQGWKKIGILYTDDPLGQQFYQRAVVQAGISKILITQFHAIPLTGTDSLQNELENMVSRGTRIMIVAASGDPLANLMITAANMGLMTNEYAWLLMGEASDDLADSIQTYNANHTKQIDFNQTFSGLFMFDNWLTLYGYPPFESFLDLWSALDPAALAYSCMMVMAQGFSHTISTISNQTYALEQLASGELGQYLLPSAFNVGYVGPEGPMVYDSNGDLTNG
ncbi:periplasmic binding protein-like I [Phycomyces nitens]|nr:periplasmic binding protein-like I [Phycomyces nitens]